MIWFNLVWSGFVAFIDLTEVKMTINQGSARHWATLLLVSVFSWTRFINVMPSPCLPPQNFKIFENLNFGKSFENYRNILKLGMSILTWAILTLMRPDFHAILTKLHFNYSKMTPIECNRWQNRNSIFIILFKNWYLKSNIDFVIISH